MVAMATGTEKTQVQQCIEKCDKVIAAKDKELQLANLAVQQARTEFAAVKSENGQLKESENSPFHNPFLMATLGALIGVIVTGGVLIEVKK